MTVNEKTRSRVNLPDRTEIAAAVKAARKSLGLTQGALAAALGSSQDAVSRWERAIDSPPTKAHIVLAQLVPEEQRSFWLDLSGASNLVLVHPEHQGAADHGIRGITVLKDAAAAGTPRAIDEKEHDFNLALPSHLLPMGGKLYGLKIDGDSMEPSLRNGFIAIVDVAKRNPRELVDQMVAARDEEGGVTVKYLRKQGKLYLLVPENTSLRHPVRVIQPGDDVGIVGAVVKWIGEPPPARKR